MVCLFRTTKVDISSMSFLVESDSTCTKEAMRNVVKEVSRLEAQERQELEDETGRPKKWPTQKYHFTLIRCNPVCDYCSVEIRDFSCSS